MQSTPSAAALPINDEITLGLRVGSQSIPTLRLSLSVKRRQFYVSLYAPFERRQPQKQLAFTSADFGRTCLSEDQMGWSLCVDRTVFELSISEAAQIRATFEPFGLRINTQLAPGAA